MYYNRGPARIMAALSDSNVLSLSHMLTADQARKHFKVPCHCSYKLQKAGVVYL